MIDLSALIEKLRQIIPAMEWVVFQGKEHEVPPGFSMECYEGHGDSWRILTVHFRTNDGHEGYDGTATSGAVILHLTPELAMFAFQTAEKRRAL